jgi:hypothetical protein
MDASLLDQVGFVREADGSLARNRRNSARNRRGLACARTETERELFLRRIDECRGVRS